MEDFLVAADTFAPVAISICCGHPVISRPRNASHWLLVCLAHAGAD